MATFRERTRRLAVRLLIFAAAAGPEFAQQSPGYVADRTTLASVAGSASSPGYVLEITVGEIGPVGSASVCNTGFTNSTGFWSFLGDAQVPIYLQLRHDPLDAATALLSWTGTVPQFEVLRASSAPDVLDPLNMIVSTAGCDAADPDPPAPTVFFYLVVPAGSLEATP